MVSATDYEMWLKVLPLNSNIENRQLMNLTRFSHKCVSATLCTPICYRLHIYASITQLAQYRWKPKAFLCALCFLVFVSWLVCVRTHAQQQ